MPKKMSSSEMYLFSPLDIASYIKWSQLSGEQEYYVIVSLWNLHHISLSKACGTSFKIYQKRIYHELHQLWLRDFVDEHCPLSRALDLEKQSPTLLLAKEATLELYLKLIALHLRLTEHLPIINMSWSDVFGKTGIQKISKRFWTRIDAALHALELELSGNDSATYTVDDFMQNKSFQVSLKG